MFVAGGNFPPPPGYRSICAHEPGVHERALEAPAKPFEPEEEPEEEEEQP